MPHATVPVELFTWRLTDHVCRVCFGRVLERKHATPDGPITVVRCANCGTELIKARVQDLCCCGLKTSTGKDAGFRCRRNEQPTPEQPAELAVAFGEPQTVQLKARQLRLRAPDKRPGLDLG
jgi:hypothetical protein